MERARCAMVAALAGLVLSLGACSPPRGAALTSEILKDDAEAEAGSNHAVVAVSRENIDQIIGWPGSPEPHRNWIGPGRNGSAPLLKAGDSLNVTIWDSEPNSLLVPAGVKQVTLDGVVVTSRGTIFVPYTGEVKVGGLTAERAREALQARLAETSPMVQVSLTSASGDQNTVYLVSGMQTPGAYPLAGRDQTILSTLALGGGIAPGLRNPIIRLIRGGQTYEITASQLLENAAYDTAMRGGDRILIEEDDRYYTSLGATGTERLIYFDKARITALEAISQVGGISEGRADPKGVLILRDYDSGTVRPDGKGPPKAQVVFAFDMTDADALFAARRFPVLSGDTVLVTESRLPATQSILSVFGSALGIGRGLATID